MKPRGEREQLHLMILLDVCSSEDSIHGGWEGAEAATDGSGCGDEE